MTGNRVWLFDLDNTLHNAAPHIFPHINRSMREYIERYLSVDSTEATRIRQDYWQRYGATLLGLIKHHRIDPHHFLEQTHRFDCLKRMVVGERPLDAALRKIPGRKILFSNAPQHYAEKIIRQLHIRKHFNSIWTIERLRFQPKPLSGAFHRLLDKEGLKAEQCVLVEDSPQNLRAAKRLGMKTVLISPNIGIPGYVDLRLQSILDLPRAVGKI